MEGFLDLIDFSQNATILRMLDQCIREIKPAFFNERLKNTIGTFIRVSITGQPTYDKFASALEPFMDDFRNLNLDDSVDDNIRWAIA